MQTCQACGNTNRADAMYCTRCGGPLNPRPGNVRTAPTANSTEMPPISVGGNSEAVGPVSAVRQHTVFVSHAHADNELCDRYVAALRAWGLGVWYDRTNMQDGHFLSTDIERELERRTAFVVLLTQASVASYWVNLEVSAFRSLAAQDPSRMMLPVRIAACRVPLLMTGIKWVDAVSLGFDAAIDAIAAAFGAPGRVAPLPAATPVQHATETMDDLVAQGKALVGKFETEKAIRVLERATQMDPCSFDAWFNLGQAHVKIFHDTEALAAYDRALALDSSQVWVWYHKGIAYRGLKRYEDAQAAFDKALAADHNNARMWEVKAVTYYEAERYEQALAAYDRSLALDSQDYHAWQNKGCTLYNLKRYQEALVALDMSLALRDKDNLAWRYKGKALYALGRFDEALVAYERATGQGIWAEDWHEKALTLRALGRSTEAERAEQYAEKLGWRG